MNDAENKVDTELDRLLGGGGLSALEEENVLHNVLVAVRQEKAEAAEAEAAVPMPDQRGSSGLLERLNLWLSLPVALGAAAAVFFVVLPDDGVVDPAETPSGETSPEFSPRGGGEPDQDTPGLSAAARWSLSAICAGPCRAGGELTVAARPKADGFLSAAALGPDEALVWLFAGEAAQTGVSFGYAATLPPGMAPGAYRIVLLASKAPPGDDRSQLLRRLEKHVAVAGPTHPDLLPEVSLTVEP